MGNINDTLTSIEPLVAELKSKLTDLEGQIMAIKQSSGLETGKPEEVAAPIDMQAEIAKAVTVNTEAMKAEFMAELAALMPAVNADNEALAALQTKYAATPVVEAPVAEEQPELPAQPEAPVEM